MKKLFICLSFIFILFFNNQSSYAIKIGLFVDTQNVCVSASEDAQIIDVNTNKQVAVIKKMLMYEVEKVDNQKIIVRSKYGQCTLSSKDFVIKPLNPQACVYTKEKWYRGILRIQNRDNGLTVINDICLENYVQAVLPAEMPFSWHIEALKAQAVAIRTYAIANYGKNASKGFDLVDTTMDQVYNGITAETEKTNQVVLDTEGIIMTYQDKPISAMYCSSAGGQTVSALESFGSDVPYLQSVDSFDDDSQKNGHGVGMSQHGAKNLADSGNDFYQILAHFYSNIQFCKINPLYYK